jgi:translation initiation factor 2B subunit (eIF-2B alpha/beta/delta family)
LLATFLQLLPDLKEAEVWSSLDQLKQAFPVMAVWPFCEYFFREKGLDPDVRTQFISDLHSQQQTTLERAGQAMMDFSRLLTISHSSLVRKALLGLPGKASREVVLGRGLPAEEGIGLAELLVKQEYYVKLVADWELVDEIATIDAVVLGADWVNDSGFINKAGSAQLVKAAAEQDRPVFVLAEPFKSLDHLPLNPSVYYQDWSDDGSRRNVKVFEWVGSHCGNWIHI